MVLECNLSASSWAFLMEHLLLQIVETDTQATILRHQMQDLVSPGLSRWERRRELLAILLTLDQLDARPSGLLEGTMT